MKCMVVHGTVAGFRGNEEHTLATADVFEKGKYPDGHPFSGGFGCIKIKAFPDKTHRLAPHQSCVRDDCDIKTLIFDYHGNYNFAFMFIFHSSDMFCNRFK